MLFFLNQYRVLRAVINFQLKEIASESNIPLTLVELRERVPLITTTSLYRHCIFMRRIGLIRFDYQDSGTHHISTTDKGWVYFSETKRTFYNRVLLAIWSVITLFSGALIAKIF